MVRLFAFVVEVFALASPVRDYFQRVFLRGVWGVCVEYGS